MKYSAVLLRNSPVRALAVAHALVVLALASQTATAQTPSTPLDPDAAARVEKLSKDPFRWIILHSNIQRAPAEAAKPASRPAAVVAAPARRPSTVGGATAAATTPKSGEITVAMAQPQASQSHQQAVLAVAAAEPSVSEGAVLHTVIQFDGAKRAADGAITTPGGAEVDARVNTFSFNNPNPVEASSHLEAQRKLVRVDYKVPESVGRFGGAGIRVNVPGAGIPLADKLVQGEKISGMLVMQIDVKQATRLKVFIVGPEEHSEGAYPYFILPVEPGLQTYGLMLEDFVLPAWSSTAPDIAAALKNVLGVGVEYSRGDAAGRADQGSFWVGQIRFSNIQLSAAK